MTACSAGSLSRLRRQLPPGGSLFRTAEDVCPYNMPPAYFLNASRPPGGSLYTLCLWARGCGECYLFVPRAPSVTFGASSLPEGAFFGQPRTSVPTICHRHIFLTRRTHPEGAYKRQGLVSRLALYKGLRCEAQLLRALPAPEGGVDMSYGLDMCRALDIHLTVIDMCLRHERSFGGSLYSTSRIEHCFALSTVSPGK